MSQVVFRNTKKRKEHYNVQSTISALESKLRLPTLLHLMARMDLRHNPPWTRK